MAMDGFVGHLQFPIRWWYARCVAPASGKVNDSRMPDVEVGCVWWIADVSDSGLFALAKSRLMA